jgi:exopolyphosphatase/guanosine-5'-triphosphate,3'-diphosphate pyrophosphatase
MAAEFVDPSRYAELEAQRVPVRLGHSAFLRGELEPRALDAAVEALRGFRRSLDALDIEAFRAVATSAVRESRNGAELISRVMRESGIRLEPISGMEEARLVWLAARNRVELGDQSWLLADLGGGSLELSSVDERGIAWSESYGIGTVRLLEEVGGRGASPDRLRGLLAERTRNLRLETGADSPELAGLIGTGGNIEALARLAGAEPDDVDVSALTLDELRGVIHRLSGLSYEDRIRRLGLREDRADVILPAALIYERVAVLADVDRIVVPNVGVKDGVLLDIVAGLAPSRILVRTQEQELCEAALALGRRYRFDEPHACQVARLALDLFDQLETLHELAEPDRRILLAAALLHDIGRFVSHRKHHKQSLHLIAASELPGLGPDAEIPLAALVARYHRRAKPKKRHEIYGELPDEDRQRVRKLAAILRIADALDGGHRQNVIQVRARLENETLVLTVVRRGDPPPEKRSLRKKAKLFESTYGLAVRFDSRRAVTSTSARP